MEPVLLSAEPDTLFRALGSRVAVTRRATHCCACAALVLSDVPLCDSHVKVLSGELELEPERERQRGREAERQRARKTERQRDRETECARDGTSASSERHCCRPPRELHHDFAGTSEAGGPSSEPQRRVVPGKHSVYSHFPKDRNGEICQRTKITRSPCRRRIAGVVPCAENFW